MIEHAQPLVKIMSESLATRIESEEFIQALVEVKTKLGLDAAQLVTFMSGSVAARIESEEFIQALVDFKIKLDLDTERLVKIMNDSVAARIMNPDFLPALLLLPKRTKRAVQLLCADIPIKGAWSNSPSRWLK